MGEIDYLLVFISAAIGFLFGVLVMWYTRPGDEAPASWETTDQQAIPISSLMTAPNEVIGRGSSLPSRQDQQATGQRSAPVGVLNAIRGPLRGQTFLIRPGTTLTIGRADDADIVIREEGVSRLHAHITHRNDPTSPHEFTIIDYSTNGTFLNGKRINAVASLQDEDIIRIGSSEFQFRRVRRAIHSRPRAAF
ncbi:MAG: FHA domain-containing protein [Ardenticatenia bacterium]|nr:MAG: FHA domain-containing protein [Ardenticatenia bacterium]